MTSQEDRLEQIFTAIRNDIIALKSSSGGGGAPMLVPTGTLRKIPVTDQVTFSLPIEIEADGGLELDGALEEVA